MSFEEVEIGPAEVGRYWKPENIGDYVEGFIYDFEDGDYGKQIILQLDDDQETTLPAHAHLRRYYRNLEEGDYIRVEVTRIIPPKGKREYPTFEYNVLKDPERKMYPVEVIE